MKPFTLFTKSGIELTPIQAMFFESAKLQGYDDETAKQIAELGDRTYDKAEDPINTTGHLADFIATNHERLKNKSPDYIIASFFSQ